MTQTHDDQEKLRQAVKDLRNKANMLSTCHSVLSDRYRMWNTVLMSVILSLSALEVGTAFISDQFVKNTLNILPEALMWIKGVFAILLFAAGLLLSQWDLANKTADHRTGIKHYFATVNHARYLLDSETRITKEMLEDLRTRYADTEGLPKIPDAQFLKLKQHHLRKVAISRELEKTPHTPLRQIRNKLLEQEKRT